MKTFRMADVEKIEEMLADGKTVEVEWKDGAMGWIGVYHRLLHLHWH